MLVDGRWTRDWQPVQSQDEQGRFVRQRSSFRHTIVPAGAVRDADVDDAFVAEAGRYHLYVALICPWASRTLMARTLKGLENIVTVSVVDPRLGNEGWAFGADVPGAMDDPLHDLSHVHQLYTRTEPRYNGRATVPVLWDRRRDTIVNNESADIVRILDAGFGELARSDTVLYPGTLRGEIDALNERLYTRLNNGVYRAGFASTQLAYDEAVSDIFSMLDELETRLSDGRPFLFGHEIVESDLRLFVTLVRFDVAYYGLFKCNRRCVADYRALSSYLRRVYALPGIAATVNLVHIKTGYYSIRALNPSGIVPAGPLDPLGLRQIARATESVGKREACELSEQDRLARTVPESTCGCLAEEARPSSCSRARRSSRCATRCTSAAGSSAATPATSG